MAGARARSWPSRPRRGTLVHDRERAACHATEACVTEKTPLTNRIGRHFARIKASLWVLWWRLAVNHGHYGNRTTTVPDGARHSRSGKSAGGFRTRPGHRPGQSCSAMPRPLRVGTDRRAVSASTTRQRCDQAGAPSAPHGSTCGRRAPTDTRRASQTSQGEIADRVEHLVAGAFIAVAQALGIEQAVSSNTPCSRTRRQARSPRSQRHCRSCSRTCGPGNLATEPFRAEIKRVFLAADTGLVKLISTSREARRIGAQARRRRRDGD